LSDGEAELETGGLRSRRHPWVGRAMRIGDQIDSLTREPLEVLAANPERLPQRGIVERRQIVVAPGVKADRVTGERQLPDCPGT
jgi:hypothetical protein